MLLTGIFIISTHNTIKLTKADLAKEKTEHNNTKNILLDLREKANAALLVIEQKELAFRSELKNAVDEARADTIKKSRATLRGQATEHLSPLLIDQWDHKDYRFIGSPIDYLVCVGGSAIIDGVEDIIEEVVLLEIKTGKSKMNKIQRRIRDAVITGKVKFVLYNADTEELKEWHFNDQNKNSKIE